MPSANIVLLKYFGPLPGQPVRNFLEEVRALSPAEKLELATLAADELGIPATERKFDDAPQLAVA
jgi:hypothetical protein